MKRIPRLPFRTRTGFGIERGQPCPRFSMNSTRTPQSAFLLWALLLSSLTASQAAPQFLRHHVPAAGTKSPPIGRLAETRRLDLAIGLPLRNREALSNLLAQLYDPSSPNYHRYLTPEQFTERF